MQPGTAFPIPGTASTTTFAGNDAATAASKVRKTKAPASPKTKKTVTQKTKVTKTMMKKPTREGCLTYAAHKTDIEQNTAAPSSTGCRLASFHFRICSLPAAHQACQMLPFRPRQLTLSQLAVCKSRAPSTRFIAVHFTCESVPLLSSSFLALCLQTAQQTNHLQQRVRTTPNAKLQLHLQ